MSDKFTILASATRAASATVISSAPNESYKGILVNLDITGTAGTPTLDVKLQRYDFLSTKWLDLPGGSFAQQGTINSVDLIVYPGVAETANRSVSDWAGGDLRTIATLGGTSTPSVTYSLSGLWLR